jgi:trigger factor
VQDEPQLDLENDLCFSVVYDVLPEVKVEKWQGFEAEIPEVSLSAEDIDRELEQIRERNAVVLDKNDGEAAEKDNVVTVNYCELNGAGEALAGSERQDFTFTLGSGHNIFKFDDELTGMKKGEIREFTKTWAEDFENKELAGKTKKLRVTLTALKVKTLPDLDDDFAQDVDEKYKTLEDLKNSIRERLNTDLEQRQRELKINGLLEKIMENTPVKIPESMIRLELDSRWRNLARRFNTDADGLHQLMGSSAAGSQAILDEWKPDAQRALHSRLIVETLMEDLKLEASDGELEKEFEKLAANSGTSLEDVKKYYEQEQMKEYLKEDIKEQKLFDRLLAENTIKTGKKENYIDLTANNG